MESGSAPFVHLVPTGDGRWCACFEVPPGTPGSGQYSDRSPRLAVHRAIRHLGWKAAGLDRALAEVERLEREQLLAAPLARHQA